MTEYSDNLLVGWAAIEAAELDVTMVLCNYANSVDDAQEGISVAEATDIAREDPSLVYALSPQR